MSAADKSGARTSPAPPSAADDPVKASDPSAPEAADPARFRAAAQGRALAALNVLVGLMDNASSDAVRASAANAVIDRAFGRAAPAARAGGEEAEDVEISFAWLSPEKS